MAPTIFYMVMTEESFDSKFLLLDIITVLKQRLFFFIHLVFLLFGGNVVKNSQWFCLNPFKHTSSWLFVVKLLINDSWNLKNIMIIEYFYSNVNEERKKNNVFFRFGLGFILTKCFNLSQRFFLFEIIQKVHFWKCVN